MGAWPLPGCQSMKMLVGRMQDVGMALDVQAGESPPLVPYFTPTDMVRRGLAEQVKLLQGRSYEKLPKMQMVQVQPTSGSS